MPRAAVHTSPLRSRLLRRLLDSLPLVMPKLDDVDAWDAVWMSEPGSAHGYVRASCRDQLGVGRQRFAVAVHLFSRGDHDGSLHDHRWPLAVLPLDPFGRAGVPLYAMPWEVRRRDRVLARGELEVRAGTPWAIDRCREVFHAVRALAPHLSIVLSDVTEPAARELRLSVTQLDAAVARDVLARARRVMSGFVPAAPPRAPFGARPPEDGA